MVERSKLFSWSKLWHSFKKSHTDDKVEGGSESRHHYKHGSQGLKHSLSMYGRRGWMPPWKHLHLDKRSCAQTKDVCIEGLCQTYDPKQGSIRAPYVQLIGGKTELSAQRRSQVTLLDPVENLERESYLKVNVKEAVSLAGQIASGDLDVGSFDLQQHTSGLKNRVLPLTAQEDLGFSTTFKLNTTLFSVDEEVPISETVKEMEPEIFRQKGSVSFKKLSFSRISSTPVSPRSPSETKWKMLLSCSSQAGSPRSPRSLYRPDWNSQMQERDHRKGSLSTMGSPWNSQAGGNRNHPNRASFKSSFKQGQWVTTDSDFVVLEL